ncbi:DUF3263 domain-containing protein [Gordonia pseudamarae]|jgi:hypothetical protein|uniref:DUF3263 domain-containing protein n=1 Tax=Gordonia pseudamarae TaxID=2831662 RepID=A0ABX6II61_9ACTN|nr:MULTISPECIES: DUF3263 domain-containing protein [Gordonia]MBD0021438.1 DUF3263 domain-containing protein [Gordonia sp. (in: high G+C Gram-positive bacteria)]QHN26401.1 DUF3263 domain-containing protein [Gordonia pseudamarae]QHN35296.1 DUF3263 domain-containing protein [Gordonia pseudamarae]
MDNATHQKMLDFETDWYQLGGGSSVAIREQFGLSDRDFFGQIDHLINEAPPETLSTTELDRMRKVVRRRLWMAR